MQNCNDTQEKSEIAPKRQINPDANFAALHLHRLFAAFAIHIIFEEL